MINGKIINISKDKYLVKTDIGNISSSLRGLFRKEKIVPLVGDNVILDETNNRIDKILPRTNYLNRPNIANIDYALILVSVKKPDLDLTLLDKLLVMIINNKIKPIICFSKIDLLGEKELNEFNKVKDYYDKLFITLNNNEIDKFEKLVSNKTLVVCGQTGAGKSTFINKLDPNLNLKTNEISDSLNRGKHTTRMVSLYEINDYNIADTPGFSSLELDGFSKEQIKDAFIEFEDYPCKYKDCDHIKTDGCNIENNNNILKDRYDNYVKFIKEYNENSRKFFK